MKKESINELRFFSRKLIRELGLLELDKKSNVTPQHWHALIEISNQPNITISQLGNLLLMSYSTVSRLANLLLKKGLVITKNGVDKREKYLTLTENGMKEIRHIDEFSNAKIIGAFAYLNESEQKSIIEAIQKYASALEQSRTFATQIKVHTLPTSRAIRKQIINFIENIQKNEFSIAITPEINSSILKAETDFYFNHSYNFWYAVNSAGTIIGSIGLKKTDSKNAEIKKFFVHAQYRGKGVSQKLMQVLIKAAVKHHFKYLYLGTVDILKGAQRFYDKSGFTRISSNQLPKKFDKCPLDSVFYKSACNDLIKNNVKAK